ncbi:phosphatase PAP2 family protein [Novosphingobium sp. Gsoil 351]|uniref:phosphatase PAP2 family protein n=1 Tax=Novosphingobium sp. Gsoil 351 TaxID=2675225 RepID=UPI0012B49C59|nr:phosphatase PAP2 family protein [Novosphingobium sp. Gsoil 351]QGN56017.1 hypothetical protein GKE62_17165 [Novosphingobium sp. Gsoil 351]
MSDADFPDRHDPTPPTARAILLDELPMHLITLALVVASAAVLAAHDVAITLADVTGNLMVYLCCGLFMVLPRAITLLRAHRPRHPAAFLAQHVASVVSTSAVVATLPTCAILVLLMPFFSALKAMVPVFHPYTWDATLIAADRALFFGHDPWRVIQPVLGYPVVTASLAALYHGWALVLYGGTLWLVFARAARGVRRRYILAFVLIWTVIGFALAAGMASVGPCFVGPILGNHHFDAQMAYLHAADRDLPVMTLTVQEMLLERFRHASHNLGSGITAMPSMHIAFACLFWLTVRQVSPRAGRWFFAFLVAIWIGSVHLAYHYALDGVVAVLATVAIWKLSGVIFVAWDRWRLGSTIRASAGAAFPA